MKRCLTYLTILTISILVSACKNVETSSPMKETTAEISIASPVTLDDKGIVTVSGKGFEPGSEIMVLFTTVDGVQSDIGYALTPVPVADAAGTWQAEWAYGRFVKKKLVEQGSYTMSVVDEDFNELASARVDFVQ